MLDCSDCIKRRVCYPSSPLHDWCSQGIIAMSLQVAFICGGCCYAGYQKVLGKTLGIHTVSSSRFYETIKMMLKPTTDLLSEQCEIAKSGMKALDPDTIGSFVKAVTVADGCWMTRGFHSQNFTFHVRNYINRSMLFFKHLSQRGSDEVCDEPLYEGTSKSAEGYSAGLLFAQAKSECMNV